MLAMNARKIQTCYYNIRTAEILTVHQSRGIFRGGGWEEGKKTTYCINFMVNSHFMLFVHQMFKKLLCFLLICTVLLSNIYNVYYFFLWILCSPISVDTVVSSNNSHRNGYDVLETVVKTVLESLKKTVEGLIVFIRCLLYVSMTSLGKRGANLNETELLFQKHSPKSQEPVHCEQIACIHLRLLGPLLFSVPLPCYLCWPFIWASPFTTTSE